MGAAAEAVVETLLRADPELRCLLGVERAARLVLAACLDERHPRAHDFDDIRALDQVVDEVLGNATTHDRGPVS